MFLLLHTHKLLEKRKLMKKKIIILLCAAFLFMLFTTNIKAVDTHALKNKYVLLYLPLMMWGICS